MPNINFPENIRELAQKFRSQRIEKQRIENQKRWEQEKKKKRLHALRLKTGLVYAKQVFDWAESFRDSDLGKELMRASHIPTAYENIFFFDGHVEGVDWVGLVVSPKGFFLNRGGRYSTLTQQAIKSSSDLARSVDTKVLKMACEWIDNGKVWECIERRFDYLKKHQAD